jgi:hypothetical protein
MRALESGQIRLGRRRASGRIAWIAAVLAILLQAFAVQTHVHVYGGDFELSESAGFVNAAPPADGSPQACAICGTLARTGSATLASAAEVPALDHHATEARALALPRAPPSPALPWRSRAPPLQS